MRETFKDVTISNRKFRLNKFDALTGSFVIYTLLTQILPMGLGKKIEGLESQDKSNLPVMTRERFTELQIICLKACSEIKPAGNSIVPVPIMMADGRWGVEDLENDAPLVVALTVQILGYNAQSFFGENTLNMFKDILQVE